MRRVFRWSNGPNSGPRTMLLGQLTAVQVSGEGAQFASCLGFENVDAHTDSHSRWRAMMAGGRNSHAVASDGRSAHARCACWRFMSNWRETRCVHRGPRINFASANLSHIVTRRRRSPRAVRDSRTTSAARGRRVRISNQTFARASPTKRQGKRIEAANREPWIVVPDSVSRNRYRGPPVKLAKCVARCALAPCRGH